MKRGPRAKPLAFWRWRLNRLEAIEHDKGDDDRARWRVRAARRYARKKVRELSV